MTKDHMQHRDAAGRIRFSPCPVSSLDSLHATPRSSSASKAGLHEVVDTPSPNMEGAQQNGNGHSTVSVGWVHRVSVTNSSMDVAGSEVISRLPDPLSRSTSGDMSRAGSVPLSSISVPVEDVTISVEGNTTAGEEYSQACAGIQDKEAPLYDDLDSHSTSGRSNGSDVGNEKQAGWNSAFSGGGTLSRVPSQDFIAMCNSQHLYVRGRFEKWELSRSEIKILNKLGEGDGGVIHAAKWRGLRCVAKMLRTDGDQTKRRINPQVARQDLINEITVLSHLRHPNLVLFLGACCKGEPLIILNEFLPGGNLEEYILKSWNTQGQWKPGKQKVLLWATELARALAFLHNCTTPIIHRDLKPANLLLDSDGHLKVCDFGLSRLRRLQNLGSYQMTGKTGSLRYMAPEVFQQNPSYDERVDIYSAGMILWFLVTGIRPFDRSSAEFVARKAARHNRRPPLDGVKNGHSVAMASIIDRCWSHSPSDRPSALELLRDLELLSSYNNLSQTELPLLSKDLQLEAHAFFHQAVVGPCKEPRPPFWTMGPLGAKAKHRAWMKLSTMKPSVAFDQLNLLLDDCCPSWRTGSHRTIQMKENERGRLKVSSITESMAETPEPHSNGAARDGVKADGQRDRGESSSDSGNLTQLHMEASSSKDAEDLSCKDTVQGVNELSSTGGDVDGRSSHSGGGSRPSVEWGASAEIQRRSGGSGGLSTFEGMRF